MQRIPLLIRLYERALRQVVKTVVARIIGKKIRNIRTSTRLPADRCQLMALLAKETGGIFCHAYTGEALTVGQLIKVLADFQANQK